MTEKVTIPQYDLDHLTRPLVKLIAKYFEDPENQRKFEEWQKEQQIKKGGYVDA